MAGNIDNSFGREADNRGTRGHWEWETSWTFAMFVTIRPVRIYKILVLTLLLEVNKRLHVV